MVDRFFKKFFKNVLFIWTILYIWAMLSSGSAVGVFIVGASLFVPWLIGALILGVLAWASD